MRNILLLSAYDAESHKRWRKGLVAELDGYHWTQLHLPARNFSWRIRGNSLSWAISEREVLEHDFDLIIATSMTDLSSLRGMIPNLASTPCILYFHENQFDYPASKQQVKRIEPQMVTLYGAVCADRIVFNSQYNRETFFSGVSQLLAKLPDEVPLGIVGSLREKSCVLPVPLENHFFSNKKTVKGVGQSEVNIVWNHRWEYDKGPDRLLRLVQYLPAGLNVRFHVLGQRFRQQPEAFEELKANLQANAWLGTWGYIESVDEYHEVLASCQICLSTALHDFQGLSVLEASLLGAYPLLPDRVVYSEFFPEQNLYPSYIDDPDLEARELALRIQGLVRDILQGRGMGGNVGGNGVDSSGSQFSELAWTRQKTDYKKLIESTITSS